MKKLKYLVAALCMIVLGCEEDDTPSALPLANLTVSSEVADGDTAKITASAEGATSYTFDFGDGTTGESLTGYIVKTYTMVGTNTYNVVVTAFDASGDSISETVAVSITIAEEVPEEVNLLTGGSTKTWYLAASEPGHLGVGPSKEGIDGDWWYPKWYAATAFEKCSSEESDCLCDDELTFSLDASGNVSYVLDNKGQTYFNQGHLAAAGGSGDMDLCYDFDTTGSKAVTVSSVSGNVPDEETTGMQLDLADGGFMGYYVGSSTYEILAISETALYVRTVDAADPNLAWYHKFASEPATPPMGGDGEPTSAAPTPTVDATKVISMFSDAYNDVTVDTWRTDWSSATLEDIEVEGNATKKYSALNFVGIETVSSQIDATTMTHFHTDVWTADATELRIKLVDFGPDGGFDGGDDTEHEVVIASPAQNEWVSLDIPLADFTGLTTTANISQLIYSGDPSGAITVYLDNVYFYTNDTSGGGGSEPTAAAPTPTVDEASVISMFSNAYTDVTVDTFRTDWSSATLEDVMVAGDDTKKYSDLNFVGIETVTSQIDASSMTHFHTDIWTADATEFRIKLVDFGADGAFDGGDDVEHELVIASPAQSQWVSLDIPLTDFAGLTTKANVAQLIFSGDPTGAITVYTDNIYFYDDGSTTGGGGSEPTSAAPTPSLPEADVISMFSNAYTDVTVDTFRTDWSSATLEDVMVAGDDTKKYSGLNFVGIETVTSQIDATTMTHFHTDIWTADATEFRIKLVDFGADGAFDGGDDVEHEIAIAVTPNQWMSLDIPLTDFTGLTNTANIAQLIYSGDPTGAITVYVDNIYFHK